MKARILKTENQVRKLAREAAQNETKKCTAEIYQLAMQDAAYQCMATMMCVLHREFGFGGERLSRLKDATECEFKMMADGVLGRNYNANDCVRFLREKYGIDFDVSAFEEV